MTLTQTARAHLSLLVVVLVASACGGGDGEAARPTDRPQGSPASEGPPPGFGKPSPDPSRMVTEEELATADIVLFTGNAPQGSDNGGYGFAEDDVNSPGPTLRVPAGEALTVVLENVSFESLPHDFTVVGEKDEAASPLWGAQTDPIDPGQSTLITFTPDAPGTYFYICSISGHMEFHGMWGRLVVE